MTAAHQHPELDKDIVRKHDSPMRSYMVLAIGVAALLLGWLFGRQAPGSWLTAYLVGFVYALTLALGGLFFTLLHHACRASWAVSVRRLAEAAGATLPLFLPLFVPIALGYRRIYAWTNPQNANPAMQELLAHKAPYLNGPWFLTRSVIYLLIWAWMGWWFWRRSVGEDDTPDPAVARRLRTISAPALVVFALTINFAAIDWIMSLAPSWFSTMVGVYFFAGIAPAGFALVAVPAVILRRRGVLSGAVTDEHLHDLGKMLFAWIVFWGYIAFSQFMLIWYANIPEETKWYATRLNGTWLDVTVALAFAHFILPFFFLLSRKTKRNGVTLAAAAIWMLLAHLLDVFWLIAPSTPDGAGGPIGLALTVLGFAAIFFGAFALAARRAALVPLGDPRLQESLEFETV